MKKKLSKLDIVILAMFFIGSISAIVGMKFYMEGMQDYHPKPFSEDEVKTLSNNDIKAIVVYPILTQYAYQNNGFYDYYSGKCSTCNVVSLDHLMVNATYNTGKTGFTKLVELSYPFITDITLDKHPDILKDYDEVILLHNEYMTQNEFNAIKSHPNVVYLYPNAAYVKVSVDYTKHIMTLIKGHGYGGVSNGFGYVTNDQYEYDNNCNNYQWASMPNGMALTCFPENLLTYDRHVFQTIKDYPEVTPPLISLEKSNISMPFCYHNGTCSTAPRDYSVP